ncbi:hypothetical protein RHSIM_Rhsim13G0183700 [Rhododendron simsii]|uniref:Ionotropic glutamate receptor C-terminal domain-containing protein n=1 Tax=Rhododendron simsii TaxID=118357 RepID=A0A834FYW4_RHOSS|nr:hypothetical protein RHSIM_Rhsim13G0183700 [Rhododendron simsii]
MPFLHSIIKPIFLSMPILLTSFLLVVSQVSVAEAGYCVGYNENDTFTIAVPGKASFKTFVHKTPHPENPDQKKNYSGFCIDVFEAALKQLGCDLPYEFVEFNGTYDELVKSVSNKVINLSSTSFPLHWFLDYIGERIQSNYARIAVVVWLFLALVLTQSYTANLTSMLTVSRLQPKIWSREKVGCDENAFMKTYMQKELNFTKKIITIKDEDEYLARFKNGSISAAFLENPYAKAFVNRYCRNFTLIPTKYSFGGFGFIFQKEYSPLAANVSKAILQLSQRGDLKTLEKKWLTPKECSQSQTLTEDVVDSLEYSETRMDDVDSLDLPSFQGLFLFSVATSSVCFLLFLGHLLKNYIYRSPPPVADVNENNEIV